MTTIGSEEELLAARARRRSLSLAAARACREEGEPMTLSAASGAETVGLVLLVVLVVAVPLSGDGSAVDAVLGGDDTGVCSDSSTGGALG